MFRTDLVTGISTDVVVRVSEMYALPLLSIDGFLSLSHVTEPSVFTVNRKSVGFFS